MTTYRLYPLDAARDTSRLWLAYEWANFDNAEWRPCVEHFVAAVEARGHEVVPIPAPPFKLGEDFVPIVYLIAGVPTTFTSDLLLSLIEISTEDPRVLQSVWASIGADVGWVSMSGLRDPLPGASSNTPRSHWASALWRRIWG